MPTADFVETNSDHHLDHHRDEQVDRQVDRQVDGQVEQHQRDLTRLVAFRADFYR